MKIINFFSLGLLLSISVYAMHNDSLSLVPDVHENIDIISTAVNPLSKETFIYGKMGTDQVLMKKVDGEIIRTFGNEGKVFLDDSNSVREMRLVHQKIALLEREGDYVRYTNVLFYSMQGHYLYTGELDFWMLAELNKLNQEQ